LHSRVASSVHPAQARITDFPLLGEVDRVKKHGSPARVKPPRSNPCAIHVGHASVRSVLMDNTRAAVAATELKKIDQDGPARRTQAGRSEAFIDELRARRHGPNANPPAWRSSNF